MRAKLSAMIFILGVSVHNVGLAEAAPYERVVDPTSAAVPHAASENAFAAADGGAVAIAMASAAAAAQAIATGGGTGMAAANAFKLVLVQEGVHLTPCVAYAISLALGIAYQGGDARAVSYAISRVSCS